MSDELHALEARVAKLTSALTKTCDAQLETAQMCSELQSDMAALMADFRELRRDNRKLSAAVLKLTELLDGREELKSTCSYPVAAGAYDEDIMRMIGEGCSMKDIADNIGCHVKTLHNRVRVIAPEHQSARWWSTEQVRLLKEAVASCTRWCEVAEIVGHDRTPSQCESKAHAMGLKLKQAPVKWTDEDDAFLCEHWNACDMTVSEMSTKLGRTEHALRTRAQNLGLTNRGRKKWTRDENNRKFWARGAA